MEHLTAIYSPKLSVWATGFHQKRLCACFEKHLPRNWTINQVRVALYQASQKKNKISLHIDTTMGGLINAVVGFSLGGVATMTFEHGKLKREVELPRKSAYLMTDALLQIWEHRIRASHNVGDPQYHLQERHQPRRATETGDSSRPVVTNNNSAD